MTMPMMFIVMTMPKIIMIMKLKMKMTVGKDKQEQISAEHRKTLQIIAKQVQIQAQLVSVA